MKEKYSTYDLLSIIRSQPAMYLGVWSLIRLDAFIDGYSFLARELGIEPSDQPDFYGFHDWVAAKFGWPESTAAWCNIILQESGGDDQKALESIFELIDEYRTSGAISSEKLD